MCAGRAGSLWRWYSGSVICGKAGLAEGRGSKGVGAGGRGWRRGGRCWLRVREFCLERVAVNRLALPGLQRGLFVRTHSKILLKAVAVVKALRQNTSAAMALMDTRLYLERVAGRGVRGRITGARGARVCAQTQQVVQREVGCAPCHSTRVLCIGRSTLQRLGILQKQSQPDYAPRLDSVYRYVCMEYDAKKILQTSSSLFQARDTNAAVVSSYKPGQVKQSAAKQALKVLKAHIRRAGHPRCCRVFKQQVLGQQELDKREQLVGWCLHQIIERQLHIAPTHF